MIFFPNAAVTVLRAKTVIDMGSEFTDWNNPERIDVPEECHVQTGATREEYERADSVATEYTMWTPLEPAIKPGDRIEFTYTAPGLEDVTITGLQVDGRPRIMVDPIDPEESFQRARLTLVEG